MNSPLKILIADDHPLFRLGLWKMVEGGIACELDEAADGRAALALIATKQPDVAILDINMPGLDGLEVLRQMRQRQLPGEVIFLTMHKEPELFDAAMNLD